jgi:hypothetical protein
MLLRIFDMFGVIAIISNATWHDDCFDSNLRYRDNHGGIHKNEVNRFFLS